MRQCLRLKEIPEEANLRLQMNTNMIRQFSLRSLKNKNNLWICCSSFSSFSWFRYFQFFGRARRLFDGAKFLSAPKRHVNDVIRFVSGHYFREPYLLRLDRYHTLDARCRWTLAPHLFLGHHRNIGSFSFIIDLYSAFC